MTIENNKEVIVYLADLRHTYQGVLSSDAMPLGIGYMKAVMDISVPNCHSEIFAFPEELEERLKESPPNVLFLTNYMWNENLGKTFAKQAKLLNQSTLVVMGGPNIPIEDQRKIEFLEGSPFIDIYATGEGDFYASELVNLFVGVNLSIEKLLDLHFHSSVYRYKNNTIIVTPIKPRQKALDEIPSPWLTGVMDKFFEGQLAPLFETNRGCPFTCSFCVQGTKWYTKVNYFSLERIESELNYIGAKLKEKNPGQKLLRLADPNFGMYERDIQVASYLGETQKKYEWPLFIDATTGKNMAENIIKSMEKVNGALVMYQAVQSLDENVLENVNRKNIRLETYKELQVYIKGRGLKSSSDLILGLPGETLQSHLHSLQKLINSGTGKLNNFQSMMLKGSPLETLEERKKHNFKTKFRLIPKTFGTYFNEKVFDIDEIITETNSLSFNDYLIARKYHFVVSLFWNESRFEPLVNFIESMGFEKWDFIECIINYFNANQDLEVSQLMDSFVNETKNELFDSREDLIAFFSQSSNFEKALRSEIGDNLIYKYRAISSFWMWDETCHFVFSSIRTLISQKHPEFNSDLTDLFLKDWESFMRLSYSNGRNKVELFSGYSGTFHFNINSWLTNLETADLKQYLMESPQTINFLPEKKNNILLQGALDIWDYSLKSLPMLIKRIHPNWLVRKVQF